MSRRSHYRSQKGARPGPHLPPPVSPAATSGPERPFAIAAAGAMPGPASDRPERDAPRPAPVQPPADGQAVDGNARTTPSAGHPAGHPAGPGDRNTAPDRRTTALANGARDGRAAADAPAAPGAETVIHGHAAANGCTAPQLRRFIKSRSWVPMHELRRRFGIDGSEDDVTPVAVDGLTIFLGLPPREGQLLGELLRAGDIGYELSLDPRTPVVIGVYPMRPVPRH